MSLGYGPVIASSVCLYCKGTEVVMQKNGHLAFGLHLMRSCWTSRRAPRGDKANGIPAAHLGAPARTRPPAEP